MIRPANTNPHQMEGIAMTAPEVADATQDDALIEQTDNFGEPGQPEVDQSPDVTITGDASGGEGQS